MPSSTDVAITCERCGERDALVHRLRILKPDAIPKGWVIRPGGLTYCPKCWRWMEYEAKRT